MNARIKIYDGLRVIALLLVLSYHLLPNIFPSGYLGVNIFFALSGFLCMQKIILRKNMADFNDTIRSLKTRFYKLYPPLILLIAMVSFIMILCFTDFIKNYFIETLYSILPINNIVQFLRNESYFESMNSIKPYTHLWALSLEIQFYVFFYLAIFPTYKHNKKDKFLKIFIILLIVSIAYGIFLLVNGCELSRIYYDVIARMSTFIMGMISCVMANTFKNKLKRNIIPIEWIIIIILIASSFIEIKSNKIIFSCINVYSILVAILLILLYYDGKNKKYSLVYKLLGNKIFVEISKRSYVIYLVHYPLIIFINRLIAHTKISTFLYVLLTLAAIIIVSEVLYRFINEIFYSENHKIISKFIFATALTYIFIVLVLIKVFNFNETAYIEEEADISSPSIVEMIDEDSIKLLEYVHKVNENIGGDATLSDEEFFEYRKKNITMIGDSISMLSIDALRQYFPNSYLDCKGNRQLKDAEKIFDDIKADGKLYDVLVVSLGTNSDHSLEMDALENIYAKLDGKPLILLSIVLPYTSTERNRNMAIKKFVESHNNCFLADFYGTMKTKDIYFQMDQIHPVGLGKYAFAQIVYKAMVDVFSRKNIDGNGQKISKKIVNK